ncbi:MAG: nucleotide exchange factor GrpE [Deltaproteobacteria bacterium]|jgi:molecular chaperone GrpE|nr:nucleotide exchange factor GrpE [Deltaproteobacteria bacterium]
MTRKNPYLNPEQPAPGVDLLLDEQDSTLSAEWPGDKAAAAARSADPMSDAEWPDRLGISDAVRAAQDLAAWEDGLAEEQADTAAAGCPRCKAAEEAAAKTRAEADDARLRALADLDNARKRLGREKEEAVRYAAAGVLADILPALDNLELALEHSKGNDACKDILVGLEMTRRMLLDALKGHGLEAVGAVGEPFDPNIHEAISMTSHPDLPEGAICALLNRGYRLNERLLRPARVTVCKK